MHSPIPNPDPGAQPEAGAYRSTGVCPNCGAPSGQTNSPYCPACGALVQPARKSVSAWKIIGAVLLGLISLPLAGVGACLLLIGGMGLAGPNGGGSEVLGPAIGCLIAALLMFVGMIFLIIKR